MLAGTLPSTAEVDSELPLGIEAVTGFRSEYIFRGFKVADSVFDFQLQSGIALNNEWSVDFGGSYATATGDGDNTEATLFADLKYETTQWSAGVSLTGRDYDHPILESGMEIAPSLTWHANEDLDLTTGFAYDTGAEGLYGWLEAKWSKPVGDSAFVSLLGGTSFVSDYYDRDGWNDLYARASFTYAISKRVAVTPFVGVSIPMTSDGETNRLFGGVWFEVNF
jgi:hypothetical protein